MKRAMAAILVVSFLLVGCSPAMGPREGGGTVLGAAGGALLGSQIGSGRGRLVAVAIGTLAGALMGQDIGRTLDRADQAYMERNAQYALESTRTHQPTTWRNPDSGNYGSITPVETYQTAQGQYCREYHQTVYVGGQPQQAYGTACRQPDGKWLIVR